MSFSFCQCYRDMTITACLLLLLVLIVLQQRTQSAILIPSTELAGIMPSNLEASNLGGPWQSEEIGDRLIPIPVKGTDDNLIYVWGNLDRSKSIVLESLDPSKKCVVAQTLEYNSITSRTARSLGNGKVLVSILNNQMARRPSFANLCKVDWKMTIIDPTDCSDRQFTIARFGEKLVTILPYHNTFDALIKNVNRTKGPKTTKVVRYNDKGEIVKSFSAVIPDEDYMQILLPKEFDSTQGYYYIKNPKQTGKSIIRKLNSQFEVVKSYEFHHSKYQAFDSDAYTAEHGRFSICYFDQENRKSMKCLILDEQLNNVLLDVNTVYDTDIHEVFVRNLSDGGIVIIYSTSNQDRSQIVYVQRVDEEGRVTSPVEIGTVPKVIHSMFDFEMRDGSHCIIITVKDSIQKKCMKLAKID